MNYKTLVQKVNEMFRNGNESFFTSYVSDKNNAIEAIERKFSELRDTRVRLDKDEFRDLYKIDSTYDIALDLKILSLEKNTRNIYRYIKNNNNINSKMLYFTIALAAVEDILVNGCESVFALNVFGIDVRNEDILYIAEEIFEPLSEIYDIQDVAVATLDIIINHRHLIEIINSQLEKGILLSWCNRLPDKIIYDNNVDFINVENYIQMADIATIDIKLYEMS